MNTKMKPDSNGLRPFACRTLFLAIIISLLSSFTLAEERTSRPPLNGYRIAGEFLLGFVGFNLGIAIGGIAAEGIPIGGSSGNKEDKIEALRYSIAACTFTTPAGVALVGDIGDETGSYWASTLGAAIGLIPMAIFSKSHTNLRDDAPGWSRWVAAFGPTVGAMIGYNLTRRYKSKTELAGPALLNISPDHAVGVSFPVISPVITKTGVVAHVEFARIRM